MTRTNPIVSADQNCHWSADRVEPADRSKWVERSDSLRGKNWGERNARVGGETSVGMELDFLLGTVKNYFTSFFDLEESPVLGFVVRALTGSSDFLEGRRDQKMYSELYGHGVDELTSRSTEELKHEEGIINGFDKPEDRYGDDLVQNERQKALYGERVVSKFGEWSTQLATVKPIAYFVSGILGNSWRTGTQTLLDLPARVWWRARMFGKSIHGNFVTSVWDLTKFKFLSLFGNKEATGKFKAKANELGAASDEYFKNKYGDAYKEQANPGLGLYLKMPFDRLKEHWQNIWDPRAALEKKSDPKTGFLKRITKEERDTDPSKTFSNGYVVLDSVDDQREQKRLAATDFTGPVCAGLGLLGTVVADPLKILWGAAGFEKGKDVINALSASRKSFSLINYVFRFIIPEVSAGEEYKQLEKDYMNSPEGPNKAIAELYYAKKSRYGNAMIGMAMAAGNICEPLLHLKRGIIGDSKFGNFLVDTIIKFNDTSFLRFFSKRRETQGRLEYLRAGVQEKLGKEFATNAEYVDALSKLSDQDFDKIMEGRTLELPEQEQGVVDSFVRGCTEKFKGIKETYTGEAGYRQAAVDRKAAA